MIIYFFQIIVSIEVIHHNISIASAQVHPSKLGEWCVHAVVHVVDGDVDVALFTFLIFNAQTWLKEVFICYNVN